MPSAITCSLSLICGIHSSLFSDWRVTVSSKFFDTLVPSIATEYLCSFLTLAVFSVIFAATDTAFYEALIFLGSAKSRILPTALADTRPRTPLISFCTVQLRTLRRSLFGDSLSLYDLWSRLWGVARLLGLNGFPPCSHSSEEVG